MSVPAASGDGQLVAARHKWGRNLSYHPHVHFLVPGGELAVDGQTWLPTPNGFLLPVKAKYAYNG